MTTLFIIWGIAALMLVASFAVAWRRSGNIQGSRTVQSDLPQMLSNVVWQEVADVARALSRAAGGARPHSEKLVLLCARVFTNGHEYFMERIYGKIKIEKGRTASFFLKQIAEHRDERKGDAERGS